MSRFVFFIRNILIFLDYNFIDFRIDQFQTKISVFRVAAFQFQFSSVRSFYFLTCFNRIVQCVGKQCTKTDIVDMDYTNDGRITAIEIKALGILLLLIAVFCFVLFSVYHVSLRKAEKIVNLN